MHETERLILRRWNESDADDLYKYASNPDARPVDISRMNAETLDMEFEKGYADMQAGRTKSAAQVFADIRRDYNV